MERKIETKRLAKRENNQYEESDFIWLKMVRLAIFCFWNK